MDKGKVMRYLLDEMAWEEEIVSEKQKKTEEVKLQSKGAFFALNKLRSKIELGEFDAYINLDKVEEALKRYA